MGAKCFFIRIFSLEDVEHTDERIEGYVKNFMKGDFVLTN